MVPDSAQRLEAHLEIVRLRSGEALVEAVLAGYEAAAIAPSYWNAGIGTQV